MTILSTPMEPLRKESEYAEPMVRGLKQIPIEPSLAGVAIYMRGDLSKRLNIKAHKSFAHKSFKESATTQACFQQCQDRLVCIASGCKVRPIAVEGET